MTVAGWVQRFRDLPEPELHRLGRCDRYPRDQSGFAVAIRPGPCQVGCWWWCRCPHIQHRAEQIARHRPGIGHVVEQHHHRNTFLRHIKAGAAPATQAAAMADGELAMDHHPAQPKAIRGRGAIGEICRLRLDRRAAGGIVARRIDGLFPGNHVVKRRGNPSVPRPMQPVYRRPPAVFQRSFIADRSIRHGGCFRAQQRARHPGRVEDMPAHQQAEIGAGTVLHQIPEYAKILVAVGIASARRKLQRCRSRRQITCIVRSEHAFRRSAAQNRGCPIVAQAGLVMRQMQH